MLEDVLVTSELNSGVSRPPDYEGEARALGALARELAANPRGLLHKVVELAMELCRADSAAVSILDPGGAHGTLRWHAAAGPLARTVTLTTAREALQHGDVSLRETVVLCERPQRYFPDLRDVDPPICESLLASWAVDGRRVGMLWAIGQTPDRRFDAEDARLLERLAPFAAAACRTAAALELANARRDEREPGAELWAAQPRRGGALSIDTVGVLFFSLDGRMTDANAAFERMSGYTRAELTTVHWEELTPPEFMDVTARAAEELAIRGETAPYEKQLIRKDGSRWWGLFAPKRLAGSGRDAECVEFIIDVTDRKRAEERLRLSLMASGMGTFMWHVEDDRCELDARMRELFGLAPDGELNLAIALGHIIHPDDRAHYVEAIAKATDPAGDGVLRDDIRVRRGIDGQERWIAVTGQTAFEREPRRAVRIAGMTADVTERKRAEAVLRENAARQAFLLALGDALRPLLDPVRVQAEAARVLGEHLAVSRALYAEVEGDGNTVRVHANFCAPDVASIAGRYRLDAFGAFVERSLRAGRTLVIADVAAMAEVTREERAAYRALGIGAYVLVPLVKGGRLAAFLAVQQVTPRVWTPADVVLMEETAERTWAAVERARAEAALRRSEQRLRVLVESVTDYAIFTLDAEGYVTSWNDGARRLKGYTADEILCEPFSRFFAPEDRAAGKPARAMQQALASGRSQDESWRVRKDGSRFWADEVMTPLRREDGTHFGFTTIARDLTERKALEDALRRAHDELEHRVRERTSELAHANALLEAEVRERRAAEGQIKALFRRLVTVQEEERRRIARDIHDQLGQQMTALRMNLEALRARSEGHSSVADEAARALRLAEELDGSIDFLTWELRPAALDHLGLAAALGNLVSGWSERFGIDAEFDAAWTDGERLAPDVESNLYRLAREALHNVVKHARASRVSVFLERRSDQAVLVIEDNGRGFSATEAPRHPAPGGLGLVSMRERATLVGGELEIESAPGRGTSIFVRVPVAAPDGRGRVE